MHEGDGLAGRATCGVRRPDRPPAAQCRAPRPPPPRRCTPGCRCSASVQGTWLSSQVPGGVCAKSCSLASGTAERLRSRDSSASDWPLREMAAGQCQYWRLTSMPSCSLSDFGRAPPPLSQQFVAISLSARFDLGLEIGNFQHRRLHARLGDEAAGAAPALDHALFGQRRQHLVHRHARAAVGGGQLMLERHAVSRRPGAGDDLFLNIRADAAIEGIAAGVFRHAHEAKSFSSVARNRVADSISIMMHATGNNLAPAVPDAIDQACAAEDEGIKDHIVRRPASAT